MSDGLAIGALLAGKYKIQRVLGAGGMGAVYLAENVEIGRAVAIKVLHAHVGADPAVRQRFRQEARTSALIAHPGIVDVLDMGETATGEAFIVMERLDGQTLGARIKQRVRLSVEEAVTIIAEAFDAIAAAHAKGVIHRDLKPDNLFLVWSPRWCVKILDFGISRLVSDDIRLTASNMVMGSVLYMPPEQARDAKSVGPAADIYALGATLYHALAGVPPFLGETYTEVLSRLIADEPVPLAAQRAELPPALCDLVMRMLAKDPAARPSDAREVRAALLAFAPTPAVPEPPMSPGLLETVPASPSGEGALAETAPSVPPAVVARGTPPPRVAGSSAIAQGTAVGHATDDSAPPGTGPERAGVSSPPVTTTHAVSGSQVATRGPRPVWLRFAVLGGSFAVTGAIVLAALRGRDSTTHSVAFDAGAGRDSVLDVAVPPAADALVDASVDGPFDARVDARVVIDATRAAHRADAAQMVGLDAPSAAVGTNRKYSVEIMPTSDAQVPVQTAP